MVPNTGRPLNYDEFNIPYTEDATVPHNGPSSGFWISNANNNFIGNSIGGCQGSGVGYWYEESTASQFEPFGTFKNNRVHGCQYGLMTVDDLGDVASGSADGKTNPSPHVKGTVTGKDLIAVINGITATRNRRRGVWVRPGWYQHLQCAARGQSRRNLNGDWRRCRRDRARSMVPNQRFGSCRYQSEQPGSFWSQRMLQPGPS